MRFPAFREQEQDKPLGLKTPCILTGASAHGLRHVPLR
jgi:hypothetical protein